MSNARRRRDNFKMPDIPEMEGLPGYQVSFNLNTKEIMET
jgi:hypothetical protein